MKSITFIITILLYFPVTAQWEISKTIDEAIDDQAKSDNTNFHKERSKHKGEGFTSEQHKANLGRIIFSSSPIIKKKENPEDFIKDYEHENNLFFRVYMVKPLMSYLAEYPEIHFTATGAQFLMKFYIDDKLISQSEVAQELSSEEKQQETTWSGSLFSREKCEACIGQEAFEKFLKIADNYLGTGNHKISVKLYPNYAFSEWENAPLVASGDLNLKVDIAELYHPEDTTMCLPQDKLNDPELKRQVLKTVNVYSKKEHWPETYTKVRFKENKWKQVKEAGLLKSQEISVILGAIYPDGSCKSQNAIIQKIRNNETNEDQITLKSIGQVEKIPCPCIK